jgi:hypothetical protein
MIYSENVQLWHPFLGVIWHGDFNYGVAKELTVHIVECLPNSQPACVWNNQNYS